MKKILFLKSLVIGFLVLGFLVSVANSIESITGNFVMLNLDQSFNPLSLIFFTLSFVLLILLAKYKEEFNLEDIVKKYNLAELDQWVSTNNGSIYNAMEVKSLRKIAQKLMEDYNFRRDVLDTVTKEFYGLQSQPINGKYSPELGDKMLKGTKGVFYARSRNGARIFYKTDGKNIYIIGISNKNQHLEDSVIETIREYYGKN
ncbi:MAG: hypothetical protein QXS41_03825 [Candidatus Woesearchaeota archaeon]